MSEGEADRLPPKVVGVLKNTEIGYLSVTSKSGDLYSYPIAFYFSGEHVYFATPISSAKLKFIKANPKVSLVVDNRDLTLNSCGAMVQGSANVYSIQQMMTSFTSTMPSGLKFSKKYPGMFSFYAKGQGLPDERKLYKYRFIRVVPTKIIYWEGYKFGKYLPKKSSSGLRQLFADLKGDSKKENSALEKIANMIESSDEDVKSEAPIAAEASWLAKMNDAASQSGVDEEERKILQLFTKNSLEAVKTSAEQHKPEVSSEEKSLLKKWRDSEPRT